MNQHKYTIKEFLFSFLLGVFIVLVAMSILFSIGVIYVAFHFNH